MQRLPHARDEIVENYPGIKLSAEQRERLEQRDGTMEELTSDPALILWVISEAMPFLIASLFDKFAEHVGEEVCLQVAREYGKAHGARNYGRFLESHGYKGGPKVFAEFQDYGHAMYGPKHATALFAEYDEEEGVVRITRDNCLWFPGPEGTPNKYVHAMETAIPEGYATVDPSIIRMDFDRCLSKGDRGGCEHHCYFKTDASSAE